MTFVIGWKTGVSVCVLGDSAITVYQDWDILKLIKSSAFSEPNIKELQRPGVKGIVDISVKVFDINGKAAIGFSGNWDLAYHIITYFRRRLMRFTNEYSPNEIQDSLTEAIENCVDKPLQNLTPEFIIGSWYNERPYLFAYKDGVFSEHLETATIGSLANDLDYQTNILKFLRTYLLKMPEFRQMIIFASFLKSFTIYDTNVFNKHGVGGTFIGIEVRKDKTVWLKDICYVLHLFREEKVMTSLSYRVDDVLYIEGTNGVIYIHDDTPQGRSEMHSRIPEPPFSFDYLVFMSMKSRNVTIVETNSETPVSAYANVVHGYILRVTPSFMEFLKEEESDLQEMIKINFRVDRASTEQYEHTFANRHKVIIENNC